MPLDVPEESASSGGLSREAVGLLAIAHHAIMRGDALQTNPSPARVFKPATVARQVHARRAQPCPNRLIFHKVHEAFF